MDGGAPQCEISYSLNDSHSHIIRAQLTANESAAAPAAAANTAKDEDGGEEEEELQRRGGGV